MPIVDPNLDFNIADNSFKAINNTNMPILAGTAVTGNWTTTSNNTTPYFTVASNYGNLIEN